MSADEEFKTAITAADEKIIAYVLRKVVLPDISKMRAVLELAITRKKPKKPKKIEVDTLTAEETEKLDNLKTQIEKVKNFRMLKKNDPLIPLIKNTDAKIIKELLKTQTISQVNKDAIKDMRRRTSPRRSEDEENKKNTKKK